MSDISQLSDAELIKLYQERSAPPAAKQQDIGKLSNDDLIKLFQSTRQPQAQQPKGPTASDTAWDVAYTIPSGLARGVANLVGLPGDVSEGIGHGINWLGEKAGYKRSEVVPSPMMPNSSKVKGAVENVTGPLYNPKTPVGNYTNAVSELVPMAAASPGSLLRNLVNFALIPGVAGEGAVDITHTRGTAAEPWIRAGTQLGAGVTSSVVNAPRNSAALANATRGVTRDQLAAAENLFQEALQSGVPISRAEALQHITNGATRLGDVQRVVEGQGRMRDFYANRVQNNDAAFGRAVDRIQPTPNPNPSTIGSEVAGAADNTLMQVRRAINDATDPLYQQARNAYLSPADMDRIKRTVPGFDEALAAVRGNAQRNRNVANLPDNNVLVLNEVKKYLDEAATNAASPLAQQRSQQIAAGLSQDASAVKQAAIDASGGVSGPYAVALEAQQQARAKYLEPLLRGPLGKMAKDDLTTQQAISALFPTNPLPNSAQEISTAVTALSKRSPAAAKDLVRAHLESVFNESTQRLQGGLNQFSGAGFAATIRGNPQQAANLEAAIRALPNGDKVWPGVNKFLEFMEAQGQRQRIGSNTSFNTEFMNELKGSNSIVDATIQGAKTGLVKLPERLNQMMETWRLGKNTDELARLFTEPGAGKDFMRLAQMPTGSQRAADTMARLAYIAQFNASKASQQGQK